MADKNTPQQIQDPKVFVHAAGSPKTGFGVSVDVGKNVWQSDNGKHSIGASAGYSQHLGGPYGNSRPDYRTGASYTFRF